MGRMTRLVFALALALTLEGCAAKQPPAPVTGGKPRLAVVIIVDGLPQRQVVDYRDQLAHDGLERFFSRGAWFTEAHYGYAITETAPGHTTIATGAYPHRSGIISNQWADHATGATTNAFADGASTYIGHRTGRNEGTSPKNLLAETLGDVLRRVDERSKVIAISDKDRGSIAPAGKRGAAYVFREDAGEFASTTYYMKEHPKWVADFNAARPASRYLGVEWRPLLGDGAYARSLPDERKWYAPGGKLPRTLPSEAGPRFHDEVMATPFGDDLLLAFARAALAGEQLGRDASPDLLYVSLSTHDYLNHAYGAESRLSHDHVLYLDRALQEFFHDLDEAIGRESYVAVLTSDHGFTPVPEYSQSIGRDAGRVNPSRLLARVNEGMVKKHGAGRWVVGYSAHALVLNRPLARSRGLSLAELGADARALAATEPGIARAFTRAEIEGAGGEGDGLLQAVRKSWHRERSGDVHLVLKPYWLLGSHSAGTTHGSPHPYDTNVPLMIYGPAWIPPVGRIDKRVEVTDIAPTLAALLGIPVPAQSEGRPLPMDPLAR
jgi:predicted AlkP superfamily pyrophosphatase or phosphodiesterase